MLGLLRRRRRGTVAPASAATGDVVLLLGDAAPALDGSEYQKRWYGRVEGRIPDVDLAAEVALQGLLREAIADGPGAVGPRLLRRRPRRGAGRVLPGRGPGRPGRPRRRLRSARPSAASDIDLVRRGAHPRGGQRRPPADVSAGCSSRCESGGVRARPGHGGGRRAAACSWAPSSWSSPWSRSARPSRGVCRPRSPADRRWGGARRILYRRVPSQAHPGRRRSVSSVSRRGARRLHLMEARISPRRVRGLRHLRARARRRPPHLLRPLRPAASRSGVRRHRRQRPDGTSWSFKEMGLVSQVFNEQTLQHPLRPAGHRPRALLHHRLQRVAERAADPPRPQRRRHRPGPQRQPGEHRRAARWV